MAKTAATPETDQTFESAISRLEAIVQQMDSPTLPLDQLIADYEEGVKLVKICQAKLKDAEQKIEIITRRTKADPELAPFEPDATSADPKPPISPRKDIRLF